MISVRERITIPARAATVWPMLRDPSLVASCIPGAALTASDENGAYRGTIRVKFGPTAAIFRGEAKLAYDDAERRCTIEGRGIDGRGASRARGSGMVTARGRAETVIEVQGNFTVTGPLETFANAGGVHLARALLSDFAANLAKLAAERPPAEAEEDEAETDEEPTATPPKAGPAPAPAAALHGGRLLWRTFLGWLRQIFAKGKAK